MTNSDKYNHLIKAVGGLNLFYRKSKPGIML